MRILHLSADYPDPVAPRKTQAIRNLLALVPEHDHHVISLNRRGGVADPAAWRGGIAARPFEDATGAHTALTYHAPPMGLFHRWFLERLAPRIAELAEAAGPPPDLLHAHKLTVEGLVALPLAARWGVPFLLTVQGNTDLKILGHRPDLRGAFARVWHTAAAVLPFAPWPAEALARRLGPRANPVLPIAVPGPADAILAPRLTPAGAAPLIVSAFNLRDAANKNATRLIRAAAACGVPDLRLEIAGGGDPGALPALGERLMPGRCSFPGPIPHDAIQARFNAATAFALVSRRESFGMVFAEALLAGTPCLYPRGRAIAGMLPDGGAVLAADPRREREIAAGLARLVREEAAFKARLAQLQETGGLAPFRRESIARTYRQALTFRMRNAG